MWELSTGSKLKDLQCFKGMFHFHLVTSTCSMRQLQTSFTYLVLPFSIGKWKCKSYNKSFNQVRAVFRPILPGYSNCNGQWIVQDLFPTKQLKNLLDYWNKVSLWVVDIHCSCSWWEFQNMLKFDVHKFHSFVQLIYIDICWTLCSFKSILI